MDHRYCRMGARSLRRRRRQSSVRDTDAHLNPAITVASVLSTGNAWRLAIYIPAQLAGAFAGAVLVWMHYMPHWAVTESADLKFACFATSQPFLIVSGISSAKCWPHSFWCSSQQLSFQNALHPAGSHRG